MDGTEWYVRTVKVGSGIRRIELQEDTAARVAASLREGLASTPDHIGAKVLDIHVAEKTGHFEIFGINSANIQIAAINIGLNDFAFVLRPRNSTGQQSGTGQSLQQEYPRQSAI